VVTKLDRLARSSAHLVEIAAASKGHIRILGTGIDTDTAAGRMMLSVVGAIAQFERELMLERQLDSPKTETRAERSCVHEGSH